MPGIQGTRGTMKVVYRSQNMASPGSAVGLIRKSCGTSMYCLGQVVSGVYVPETLGCLSLGFYLAHR